MGLFVSTTGTSVSIPELGIEIVTPTTDRDLGGQFSSDDIEQATTLTTNIRNGTLVWRKVAAGAIQPATDYEANFLEIEEENIGVGLQADRTVTFKDLTGTAVTYATPVALTPDSGNVQGVAASVSRSDHKHDVATSTPSSIGTANAEGSGSSFVRNDHVHDHGAQSTGTHHAVATSGLNGFMSSTDKIKLDALITKSGRVAAGTFTGSPKKATVTFTTAFSSTNYSVNVSGSDGRTWTIESKVAGSFVINANANQALTGEVFWQAQFDGEVG